MYEEIRDLSDLDVPNFQEVNGYLVVFRYAPSEEHLQILQLIYWLSVSLTAPFTLQTADQIILQIRAMRSESDQVSCWVSGSAKSCSQ